MILSRLFRLYVALTFDEDQRGKRLYFAVVSPYGKRTLGEWRD
jgi:hypothetical protein